MRAFKFLSLSIMLICVSFTSNAYESQSDELPLIEVSTSAKVKSLPDQAELNVTFSATNLEADKARKTVDKLVRPFLKDLTQYNIHENSLDSSQTKLHPKYEYRSNQKVFLGYQLTRNISFKLNDLSQLEKLVKEITENKASQLGGINFTLKNSEDLKREALKKAISKATKNAKTIAEGFGVRLGSIYKVKHVENAPPSSNVRMMAMSAEMADTSSNSYHQKEIEFSANISASFNID